MASETTAPVWRNSGELRLPVDHNAAVYAALRRLEPAGVRVALRRVGNRWSPAGTTACVRAGVFPHEHVLQCLQKGLAVSVNVAPGLEPDWLDVELDRLLDSAALVHFGKLEWSIEATDAEAKALIAGRFPGTTGYCFEECAALRHPDSGNPDAGAPSWLPALHAGVRSHCPLLPAERSVTLLPGNALAVPADTAWLCMELDLMRLAAADGTIDPERLDAALDRIISCGDCLIDELDWTTDAEAEDARLNRRLAVLVTGIGDLVVARSADPSSLASLRELDRLVGHIHDGLWLRSRRLALATRPVPALTERAPSAGWRDESRRRDWSLRWQEAVSQVQVRHRNLLAISPWSVLPRGGNVNPAFADLMPVLAHADAVGFARRRLPSNWRPDDIRYFNARLAAQVERFNATSFIAIGA